MPPKKKTTPAPTTAAPVSSYKHDSKRARIPTQEESVKLSRREKQPVKKTYAYDPSLDPQLVWSGKKEQGTEFDVPTVPIYVQEKIAPEAIIARLKAGSADDRQMLLFGETAEDQFHKAVEFYKHEDNWQNRLILGDSLLVMNSLLEKEGMRGKVQTIYMDPPYGIKFGSNWQVSTRNRDVKNNKIEDFIRQPEQVKAFRDTWELGIHSYLSYLRDRLITARELLNESGSCFVQISDENVHLVRNVMDEVFGNDNFVSEIIFIRGVAGLGDTVSVINDYIVWYAKDKTRIKSRTIFNEKSQKILNSAYNYLELSDGSVRRLTSDEIAGKKEFTGKRFKSSAIVARDASKSGSNDFEYKQTLYKLPHNTHWKTSQQGLENLAKKDRLLGIGKTLVYKMYADDFPYVPISNVWDDVFESTFAIEKWYVVQTQTKVIQRCLLMTTDPGDIVLDPTCGAPRGAIKQYLKGKETIRIDSSMPQYC